jgi:hypothetical protein
MHSALDIERKAGLGVNVGAKCTQFAPNFGEFLRPKTFRKSFALYGGDDGARTRDLCRDRHRFEVFQRLTNPWGTPKTTEVVEDRAFCGSDCGSGPNVVLISAALRNCLPERRSRSINRVRCG